MKIKSFILGHKKIFIPVGILVALLAGFSVFGQGKDNSTMLSKSETTLIKKKDFSNTVTESGKLVSEDSMDIYAEKNLPVSEVNIKVGDEVVAGQIIAKLDDSTIRQQIETKEALIGATNRTTGTQVKGAKDKLNEALTNKNNGTNAQVVTANANILQTYDQWQSAEKVYSDYLRSLREGYNEAFVAKKAADTTLRNTWETQKLTYDQSLKKLDELNSEIENARNGYNEKSTEVDRLKGIEEGITRQINDLTLQAEEESAKLQSSATTKDSSNDNGSGTLNANNAIRAQEEARRAQEEARRVQEAVSGYKKQINDLTIQATQLKTQIADAEADRTKYKTQIETNDDAKLALEKEIAQQNQNLDNSKNSIASQGAQDQMSENTREDLLKTYEKNANDAKNIYENAKKNLTVAIAAQDSEIRSLQSGVEQAKASGDNSVNSVDLKNLYEELEKTVVKAPISGTITKVDMVKGQAPTTALAQVQTVKRTIIESQVKEYDYPNIKVGMPVEVTSDALGRKNVFKGKVESINPTPKMSADGQTQQKDVAYLTKISIEDPENKLQPGMTTRIKYVLESKKDVIVVPSTAIYKKADKSFMLVVEDKENTTIKEIEVKVLTGNDIESVISSNQLKGKLRVINAADKYQSGTEVKLVEEPKEMEAKK